MGQTVPGNLTPKNDMESFCKDHKEPLSMYCVKCKIPICSGCSSKHIDMNCGKIEYLPSYFSTNILPHYKSQLNNF